MALELNNNFQTEFPNNPNNISAEIDKNVINSTTPEGFKEDPYAQQLIADRDARNAVAPIGPQGAALYPGLGHNINVGSTSGSEIGSGNIYVPGGNIMSIDPVLARRKAIADAAKSRAAEISPFEGKDPMQLNDARFQKNFNDSYYKTMNGITEATFKEHGVDANTILSDRNTAAGKKIIQVGANYEYLGRNMNQITDKLALVEEGLESGELSFNPRTLKLVDNLRSLTGNFEDADVFAAQDLQTQYELLEGAIAIEEYVGQSGFLDNIMGETTGNNYTFDSGEFYSTKTNKKVSYKEVIPQVAKSLAEGPLIGGLRIGAYTLEDIEAVVESKFKDQQTQTGTISKKNEGRIAEEQVSPDGQTFDEAREDNNYTYDEDGTLSTVQAQPGQVHSRHDVNLTGKTQMITVTSADGTMKSIPVKGIPITQATFLNGDKTQNFEETAYAKLTGFSTITRDGKDYVVANTSTIAPAKISYRKDDNGNWKEMKAKEWKGLERNSEGPKKGEISKNPNSYKRVTEYREVQVPMVLVDADGKETGTFNEFLDNTSEKNKASVQKAYDEEVESRTKQAGGAAKPKPAGTTFN